MDISGHQTIRVEIKMKITMIIQYDWSCMSVILYSDSQVVEEAETILVEFLVVFKILVQPPKFNL